MENNMVLSHKEMYGVEYEQHIQQNAENLLKNYEVKMDDSKERIYDYELCHLMVQSEGFYVKYKDDLDFYIPSDKSFKFILQIIKEFWKEHNEVPSFSQIFVEIQKNGTITDSNGNKKYIQQFKVAEDFLEQVKLHIPKTKKFIEDIFKQELIERIENHLSNNPKSKDRGRLLRRIHYYETNDVGGMDVDICDVYDYNPDKLRITIPTKISLIDNNGGVARGEMGIVIAPTGVGKSTCLTHIASEMAQDKYKVLHIIFEGDLNRQLELHNRKLGTKLLSSNMTHIKDYLKIAKLPEGETTISDVIGAIEKTKKIIEGIDVVVIDYLDCIKSDNKFRDFWQGESDVVNELEKYAVDNNIVLWTAVQTNRSGLNGEDGNNSQVAGSKKKLDKASMVVFLTRSEIQKESNVATMKITKNRHGILKESRNFRYNPSELTINTDDIQTIE